MKIKDSFELRSICGENIIIASGKENINFTKVISLNESAAYVWNKVVDTDFTTDDVVRLLCDEYEVNEEDARRDSEALVKQWSELGFLIS